MLRAALLVSTLLMACDEAAPSAAVERAQGGAGSGTATTAHSGTENSPIAGEYEPGEAGQASTDAGASSRGGTLGAAGNVAGGGSGHALGGAVGSSDGGGSGGKVSADEEAGHAGIWNEGGAGTGSAAVSLCALVIAHGDAPVVLAESVSEGYMQVLNMDCRYTGLKCGVGIQAKVDFANGLAPFALRLWHCDDSVATGFLLVHPGRTVTRADAEELIELYVELTAQKLKLAASDVDRLRNDLLALMTASLASNSPKISLCSSDGQCALGGAAGFAGSGGVSGSSDSIAGATSQGGTN